MGARTNEQQRAMTQLKQTLTDIGHPPGDGREIDVSEVLTLLTLVLARLIKLEDVAEETSGLERSFKEENS